jgi:hypothetical protein
VVSQGFFLYCFFYRGAAPRLASTSSASRGGPPGPLPFKGRIDGGLAGIPSPEDGGAGVVCVMKGDNGWLKDRRTEIAARIYRPAKMLQLVWAPPFFRREGIGVGWSGAAPRANKNCTCFRNLMINDLEITSKTRQIARNIIKTKEMW